MTFAETCPSISASLSVTRTWFSKPSHSARAKHLVSNSTALKPRVPSTRCAISIRCDSSAALPPRYPSSSATGALPPPLRRLPESFWHFVSEYLPFRSSIVYEGRGQGAEQYRSRQFMSSSLSEEMQSKPKKIDSHLHVWASPDEAKEFPHALGQEPKLPGSATFLVENMSEAGVDGALIIQPIDHKFDHRYVSSVLQKYPGKFVGCCLADPTEGGGGVKELERLITKEGYRAVRFNPYLWPAGQQMTNKVGKAMFSKAGELGAVVGFMCFKGLLLHIEDIEDLCAEYPSTTVMIDHFGFCKPAKSHEEAKAWERLLQLARFPQVFVKVSAFFRVSREPFPYKDTWPLVQELLSVYGAKRLLWGSDFPFVAAECGYGPAHRDLPQLIAETLPVSELEMEDLLGGTACQLFAGAWQESLVVS